MAWGLLDGARGEVTVVERALGHPPVDGELHLLLDLCHAQLRHRGVAAALLGNELVRVEDGLLAALHGHVHGFSPPPGRSEEHTSELQSLMRISYAVFCLKKKKKKIL